MTRRPCVSCASRRLCSRYILARTGYKCESGSNLIWWCRQSKSVQPTPATLGWRYAFCINVVKKIFFFFALSLHFFPVITLYFHIHFFFSPNGRLYSLFVSHNYSQESMGVWACALCAFLRRFEFKKKKKKGKDKVFVHLSLCAWSSVYVGVCIVECVCECVSLVASGDCQVGYRETVMTASLLPGWPPTRCTRLAVTAMMC